ncbi:MAG: DoxX family protein [Bacteroidota bacterium]|nr:DoxX family protein [Bacteroidota bacterium]
MKKGEILKEANITEKTNTTQPLWLTIVRIALGLTLFFKGIIFTRDSSDLQLLLHRMSIGVVDQNSQVIAFIITYITLLGGLFITVGLFTKTSSIIQIPILIGAVFFVNTKSGLNQSASELILSTIVLLLLILFAVKGSGALSADEYFRSYYKAGAEDGNTKKVFKQEMN